MPNGRSSKRCILQAMLKKLLFYATKFLKKQFSDINYYYYGTYFDKVQSFNFFTQLHVQKVRKPVSVC